MNVTRRFAAWAAIALGVVAVAAGCGNRGGSLVGYRPEGVTSNDLLFSVVTFTDTTLSSVQAGGLVYAKVPTNGERLYVDPAGTGFRPGADGVASPLRVFSTGWGVYAIQLSAFDPLAGNVLLARGARDGRESVASVVTNSAGIPAAPGAQLAQLNLINPIFPAAPVDSPDVLPAVFPDTLVFRFTSHPEDVYYRFSIYDQQRLLRFQVIGDFVTGGPPQVIENLVKFYNQPNYWTIETFDADHRLIGIMSRLGGFIPHHPPGSAAGAADFALAGPGGMPVRLVRVPADGSSAGRQPVAGSAQTFGALQPR